MNVENLKSIMPTVSKVAQSNKTKTDKFKYPPYPEIIGSWDNNPDKQKATKQQK
jgi:hypothetical protein